MPIAPDHLLLALLLAVGSFVQALTGFAMGLIAMGVVAALGVVPLPFAAAVVSILSLVNGGWVLRRHWREVDRRLWLQMTLPLVPGVLLGLHWLDSLHAGVPALLHVLLGLVIIAGGANLMLRPGPRTEPATGWSAMASGALGGVLGGLFSTAGPPIVYLAYREPLALATIRATLLAVFAAATVTRIVGLWWQDQWTAGMGHATLLALPGVVLGAQLGAQWALRLHPARVRRVAFGLLMLTGTLVLLQGAQRLSGNG